MTSKTVAAATEKKHSSKTGSIGVVLVNWNGWKDTIEAYNSTCRSTYQNWTLIVVDNASTDESVARLSELGNGIHLVRNDANLGFAGACNVAVLEAERLALDYLFFLNNDAAVTPETLDHLVRASKSQDDKAVLGSVVRYQETGELQFFGSQTSDYRGVPQWPPASEESFAGRPDLIESDFIFGAALFVPMALIRSVGMFDERFFLNYEETDWCYRARRRGASCFVVKSALTYHKGSASLGPVSGPMQAYFLQRNELLFAEKNASKLQLLRAYKKALAQTRARLREGLRRRPGRPGLDPSTHAHLLALRDYVLRRFGDCPPIVRRLAQEFREAALRGEGKA